MEMAQEVPAPWMMRMRTPTDAAGSMYRETHPAEWLGTFHYRGKTGGYKRHESEVSTNWKQIESIFQGAGSRSDAEVELNRSTR